MACGKKTTICQKVPFLSDARTHEARIHSEFTAQTRVLVSQGHLVDWQIVLLKLLSCNLWSGLSEFFASYMCADGCRGLCDGIPLLLIRLCTKVFLPRTDPYSSESSVSFHSSFCENSVRSARTRASDTMLKRVILCLTYSLVSAFIKFLDWFHHLFLSVFIFDPLAGWLAQLPEATQEMWGHCNTLGNARIAIWKNSHHWLYSHRSVHLMVFAQRTNSRP